MTLLEIAFSRELDWVECARCKFASWGAGQWVSRFKMLIFVYLCLYIWICIFICTFVFVYLQVEEQAGEWGGWRCLHWCRQPGLKEDRHTNKQTRSLQRYYPPQQTDRWGSFKEWYHSLSQQKENKRPLKTQIWCQSEIWEKSKRRRWKSWRKQTKNKKNWQNSGELKEIIDKQWKWQSNKGRRELKEQL